MKPELYLTFRMPWELEALRDSEFIVHHSEGRPLSLDASACVRVRGIVTNGIRGAEQALIDSFPNLEIIASLGIGLDALHLPTARARGIIVTNTPGQVADDVADLAILMLIDRLRRVREANRFLRDGEWLQGPMPLARSVTGTTIGIVGFGAIGRAIAQRASALRVNVKWTGPRPKPEVPHEYVPDLVQLASCVDVLIVCCAGSTATRHLIDARVLQALGSEGILINVSRGLVVDTEALIVALQEGAIAGAALDVFEQQPKVPEALLAMDNVLLTPHLGSSTRETRGRMGAMVVESLRDHFAGREPGNIVR